MYYALVTLFDTETGLYWYFAQTLSHWARPAVSITSPWHGMIRSHLAARMGCTSVLNSLYRQHAISISTGLPLRLTPCP